jgi:hypothetical protein
MYQRNQGIREGWYKVSVLWKKKLLYDKVHVGVLKTKISRLKPHTVGVLFIVKKQNEMGREYLYMSVGVMRD